ncbi:MAG: hypothetical protein Q9170_007116 [Blastenia crenularia]
MFRSGSGSQRRSDESGTDTKWEISHVKALHIFEKAALRTPFNTPEASSNTDPLNFADINDRTVRSIAVGFAPGYKTLAVTVGSDGRCCVVDFESPQSREAEIICSWELAGQATCLSVLSPSPQTDYTGPVGALRKHDSASRTTIVAIGTQDGQVLLFDLAGALLMQQMPLSTSQGIIHLEWMEGSDWPEPSVFKPPQGVPDRQNRGAKRKSLGSVLASGRVAAEEVVSIRNENVTEEVSKEIEPKPLDNPKSASEMAGDRLVSAEGSTGIQQSPALNYMDLPSMMRKLYPAEAKYEDSSGKADTSSSGSLADIINNFQFPSPPHHGKPQVVQKQRVERQLPRNNSWATQFRPLETDLTDEAHRDKRDGVPTGVFGRPAFNSKRTHRILKDLRNIPTGITINQNAAGGEGLWTDIDDKGSPSNEQYNLGSSNKENEPASNVVDDNAARTLDAGPLKGLLNHEVPQKVRHGDASFAIHVDEPHEIDHPQPLRAHPGKSPTSAPRPLASTKANTFHQVSVMRDPFRRHRYKNGNIESHRSSIYGPGALARKIQQEIMITVNVELDVLRREMSEKFDDQRKWLIKELMNSQEWTLRVGEENRKLREELAKERQKKPVERDGVRTLC